MLQARFADFPPEASANDLKVPRQWLKGDYIGCGIPYRSDSEREQTNAVAT